MSEFRLQFNLINDSECEGCPCLYWRASDAYYVCGVKIRRVHGGLYSTGVIRPEWCPLQKIEVKDDATTISFTV